QTPMSDERIDIETKLQLSRRGFKHPKLVTEQTHPEFYAHWKTLCSRAGFMNPMQLMICESDIPNASAMSQTEMMVSTGLLKILTYREVCGVLGHELAHAKNMENHRNQHVAAVGGLSFLGLVLPWFGGGNAVATWSHILSRFLGSAVGSNIGGRLGRKIDGYSSELQADFEGAIISGDPDAIASGLMKLEDSTRQLPAWKQALRKITGIHPEVSERVKWLQEVKQELQTSQASPAIATLVQTSPAPRIAGGQTSAERVSTNLVEAAI
ncbi:MAG: M48 family metallopeptidase, partial [Rickettsiales bacterium]